MHFPASKKQLLFVSLLVTLLALAGCGGSSDETASDTPEGDSSDTTEVQPATVSNDRFVDIHYSGSGICADCHDGLTDSTTGDDLSIVTAWSTSMMAQSARDPYWQAKVASEMALNPDLESVLNDTCSRCHMPMANDAAHKAGVEPEIFDTGFLHDANAYFDQAMDGVSCSLCHQIADNGILGSLEASSGEFEVEIYPDRVDRPAYGQYADPKGGNMRNQAEFTPQLGSHMGSSELCASCHNLKTPYVDSQGEVVTTTLESRFPEQMVFTEWQNSDFRAGATLEQSCQECHMPQVAGGVKIATRPTTLSERSDFARHDMLGANTVMMQILDDNRIELGVAAEGFAEAIAKNRAFLQSAAALSFVSSEIVNGELNLDLQIDNLTGHKLPTSYPSRRMFIRLLVQDENGATLFESGRLNSDGSIAEVATDSDPSSYEPHYEEITAADQVQVYEPIMQDSDGNITHALLRAAAYRKDNRIPPAGFDKAAVPDDVQVAGLAASDADFNDGSDRIRYRIAVGSSRNLTVTAELHYQALSFGHLQRLFEQDRLPEVARFKRMFEGATIRSEVIATATLSLN
jgi:mono/diheme cytochrome c family protein